MLMSSAVALTEVEYSEVFVEGKLYYFFTFFLPAKSCKICVFAEQNAITLML